MPPRLASSFLCAPSCSIPSHPASLPATFSTDPRIDPACGGASDYHASRGQLSPPRGQAWRPHLRSLHLVDPFRLGLCASLVAESLGNDTFGQLWCARVGSAWSLCGGVLGLDVPGRGRGASRGLRLVRTWLLVSRVMGSQSDCEGERQESPRWIDWDWPIRGSASSRPGPPGLAL